MTAESFLDGRVVLWAGDSLQVLPSLDENSVDSCVCDPPYHLTTGKNGGTGTASLNPNSPAGRARISTGFMGRAWDGGDIAFQPALWREVYRVLKPGAYCVAMGGDRTVHRLACAIEDAGFEIRGQLAYIFGRGFPKNHNVSKVLGNEKKRCTCDQDLRDLQIGMDPEDPLPSCSQQRGAWDHCGRCGKPMVPDGLGTALKPAMELIVLARKPISEKTVAANVLKWGTGALNIDGCRVEFCGTNDAAAAAAAVGFANSRQRGTATQSHSIGKESRDGTNSYDPFTLKGRWPANVCHDGSDEVVGAFPEAGGGFGKRHTSPNWGPASGDGGSLEIVGFGDSGSAARFFYTAKADSDDRLGSKHPTVKPLDLMQWLVRLVTPPKGLVLDCFAGTGTTGEAAFREGMRAVLVEREVEYLADIRRRMALVLGGQDERRFASIKEKMKGKPQDAGPLFGGVEADTRGGAG